MNVINNSVIFTLRPKKNKRIFDGSEREKREEEENEALRLNERIQSTTHDHLHYNYVEN